MESTLAFFTLIAIVVVPAFWFLLRDSLRQKRERELRITPFPQAYTTILEKQFPLYTRIPPSLKAELHGDILIFLEEKRFEGCNGFVVTEENKLLIAAQACVLLLNRTKYVYPRLTTVLVYPEAYVHSQTVLSESERIENDTPVAGLSYSYGVVSLAWDHVQRGARNEEDGTNVVFHEFAHQLDNETGSMDGIPRLESETNRQWIATIDREFRELIRTLHHRHTDVIDQYGATNPAEFFAVVTETFFEKPDRLNREHPKLFELFTAFYRVDPREWD